MKNFILCLFLALFSIAGYSQEPEVNRLETWAEMWSLDEAEVLGNKYTFQVAYVDTTFYKNLFVLKLGDEKHVLQPITLKDNGARYEIFRDIQGMWRFRLKAPNNKTILASEAYTRRSSARRGIKVVKSYARYAPIKYVD